MPTPIEELSPILTKLGFAIDEAKLYTAMLQLGPKPASILAKQVGIGRGKTYNLLAQLKKHAVIQEIIKSGATFFAALPLEVLSNKIRGKESELEEAENILESVIKRFHKTAEIESTESKVEYWRGDSALQAMLDRLLLHKNSELFAFLDYEKRWPAGRSTALVKWDQLYSKRRAAAKIPFYVICNRSLKSDKAFKSRKTALRNMKLVKDISFPLAIVLHKTCVIITCNAKQVFGVAIHDETVAQSFLEIFRSVWVTLPDYSIKK